MAEKFYSSRLLNYVERVDVGGYAKTAFYTEVNTNLKPGDKVFILNGNYDSDEFIDQDRYAKYVDGYRVISIDRCRIVLDIDYVGLKPYETDNIENFIKIWNVKSLRDLLYYDSISVDSYNDRRVSKFEWRLSNNILFSSSTYNVTRPDTSTYSIDISNNFWAKRSNGKWQNITSDFNLDTFSISATASGAYFSTGYNQINNGRLFIYGEDFTYNNNLFRQRNIYKFQNGEWIIDIKYQQPVISKLNFRDGRFIGNHFDGVWGTYQKSLSWSGSQSNWLSGAFVNSTWLNGNLNSKSTIASQSFYAQIDHTGLPIQTSDFSNNKGQGYNYILDSNIRSAVISDGNFINCNIGNTISSTFSAVDNYFDSVDNYELVTKGGFYNFCDIWSSKIDDASILDSRVYNSNLTNTRMLNSQFFDSIGAGEFSDENGIKILAADIYSYIPNLNAGVPEPNVDKIKGVLKLYISESDLIRLDSFDNFYITKVNKGFVINSLTSEQKVLLPYETKYILDRFWNNDFSQDLLLGSIKNTSDNKYKPYVTATGSNYYNTFQLSGVTYSSIDLELGKILAHYYQGGAGGSLVPSNPTYSIVETERVINHLNVNNLFKDTFLKNADFVSGVVENTNWTSGALINRQSNIISTLPNGKLSISVNGSNLDLQIFSTQSYYDDSLKIGKSIWLDSIYNGTSSVNISGRYKIQNIQTSGGIVTLTIQPKNGIVTGSLSGDFYFDTEVNPNFLSINSVILRNSKITSGLFERSLISNSIFENELFDNTDRNLNPSNIDLLRISKTVFKNNSNTIKSGLFYRDHFFGGTWSNAIAYEVIWKDAIFGSGIFKSGYWKSGTFTSGKFIESSDIIKTTLSFSTPTEYKNWTDGTFNGGEFEKSVWKSGTFNNGKFFNSDWYAGIWNNGILGDPNIPFDKTTMANKPLFDLTSGATFTVWNDGLVESAMVGGSASIYWYSGKFNNGLFTSNGVTQSSQSIWYGGEFNGGEFAKLAKWKNGEFNGGQFNSYHGWTFSGLTDSQYYGWENGNFNGGKFGNANYATNSIWFNGVFNDGIFQGRVWNDGIFNKGRFIGGATWSPRIYEDNFVNSFTNSFYGLWRNGTVIDVKTNLPSENKFYSIRKRVKEERRENVDVQFTRSLWLNGTFSSNSGIFDTSIWLGGRFNAGKFTQSVFNPFVNRSPFYPGVTTSKTFDKNSSTVWNNGEFLSGNFYFSEWKNGTFQNGTMSGAIWRNGVWNYGDAYNIYWEDGRWRNGNWDGTPFVPEVVSVTASYSPYQVNVPSVGNFWFRSSVQLGVNQKIRVYQGIEIINGVILQSHTSPFGFETIIEVTSGSPNISTAINKVERLDVISDYSKELMVRVAQANATHSVHIFNAFTGPTTSGQLLNFVENPTGQELPFNGLEFETGITYSILSPDDSFSDTPPQRPFENYYLINPIPVKAATYNSNITLSGLQTIDGVNLIAGDRVLVKNQGTSPGFVSNQNGVYVVSSGAWSRATDAPTQSLFRTDAGRPTFYVQLGTTNSNTYWYQRSPANTFAFSSSGLSLWNIIQEGYVNYQTPIRTVLRAYNTNTSDPWSKGKSRRLTLLAKGITASVFSEPVGTPGYYSISVTYNMRYDSAPGVGDAVVKLSLYTGAYYFRNMIDDLTGYKQLVQSITVSIAKGASVFSTYSVVYTPDLNRINAVTTNDSNGTLYTQEMVTYGYNQMLGRLFQIEASSVNTYTDQVLVDIVDVRVIKWSPAYQSSFNNKLLNIWNTTGVPTYSSLATLPNVKFVSVVSDSGFIVSLKYGNGVFRSGIWENGIWNNGWRSDTTIVRCLLNSKYLFESSFNSNSVNLGSKTITLQPSLVGSDFIKINYFTFNLSLTSLDSLSRFRVGDKVSISNIVAVDNNGNRNFIKGFSTVNSIVGDSVILDVKVPINTVSIEADSIEHLIMMTKNVWLSGAFLNGRFTGVWNYGLVQGYPYITLLEDTHWIDGIFDGGTFRGVSSVYSVTASVSKSYSKPLIQNFNFYDNNVSTPSSFEFNNKFYIDTAKYLSWIDVNYFTSSKTNIGQETTLFNSNLEIEVTNTNLNGYPTKDILSSRSTFRDLISKDEKVYSLGYKYKTFKEYIPNSNLNKQFFEPVSNLSLPLFTGGTLSSKLFRNFSKYGWTYSTTNSNGLNVYSNLNTVSSGLLFLRIPSGGFTLLNNSNITIENNRYSVIEFRLNKFEGRATYSFVTPDNYTVTYPSIYLLNDPRSDAPGNPNHESINRDIVNHILTPETTKREFFYNRVNLGMYMTGSMTASFSKIVFNEVDMIPFFQYATESQIDKDIKSPYKATAPFIDYSNNQFNFISSISLNIDSVGNYSVPVAPIVYFDPSANTQAFNLSDMRHKINFSRIDTSNLGINIYEFEYNSEPGQRYIGVMAQELLGTQFSNAVIEKNQTLYVDYSKIDVDFKKIV